MLDAYEATSMLKLGVQIESMTSYDDYLLIGTREGHLLMYNVASNSIDAKGENNPSLFRYSKNFSKKRIVQIAVVPEYNLLLLLTDNIVCIHDLKSTNLNQIGQLQKTKGATLFAIDIQRHETMTGEQNTVVRLCVAVKRKLQLYYWKDKNKTFEEFFKEDVPGSDVPRELSVPDIPRELAWCGETLVLGFRGFSYTLMDFLGKSKELFPTGKSPEPSITKISDNSFVLGKDLTSVIMNTKGQLIQHNPVKWSDLPTALVWDDPYLLGIVHDTLEVYTLDNCLHIQTIPELNKARLICRCKQGKVYVASMSQVWSISATDFTHQIRILLEQSEFQLALKLTNLSDLSEEEKAKKTYKIQTHYAHYLFRNKKFREAMEQFSKLGTNPYDVIRLFPDLISQESNANEQNDIEPHLPKLQDRDLESGLMALIDFLTEVRYKLINDNQAKKKEANEKSNGKSIQSEKPKNTATEKLLKIIDTTLLKCYLQTNDALVAPLLRLNHCHLGEAEKTLLQHQKYPELIILYQTKGQHKKALELLEEQSKESDSSLKGTERTIQYLQHLGKDHMDLILKFAGSVLDQDPGEGLRIFMEDVQEVEQLPRPKVLDYLLRCHKDLAIQYLEHVVHVWEDDNPLFHNVLVHQYRDKCLAALSPNATPAEKQNIQHIRQKLQQFLEKSQHYTPETVLRDFPLDCLFEERAIILGRLGRYQQAVSIYINLLNDVPKAIQFCNNVYARYQCKSQSDKNKPANSSAAEVYITLIRQLLRPDESDSELPSMVDSQKPRIAQPDLETALELLEEHASKIEPLKAIEVLPNSVPIGRLRHFLEASMQDNINEKRRMQVLKGLLYAEHLQVQEQRIHYESQSVLMTEFNICPVCKKRFGNQSAFARYPNGDIVHYSCQRKV